MKRLIVAILVVAGLWMSWWAIGSTAHEKGILAWLEDRRSDGWQAEMESLEVKGFPNRFDTRITDLNLVDPASGIAWSAPFVEILSLAYKPHEVILGLPDAHRFATPFQVIEIAHVDTKASLFLRPSTSLELNSLRLVANDLSLKSTLGWDLALESGRFAFEHEAATKAGYRLGFDATNFKPSELWRRNVDPAGILPERFQTLRIDADLRFDAPWDRLALERRRPQMVALDIREASAIWGDVTFRMAGELTVDGRGVPEGKITIKAVEWRRILDMVAASGLLLEEFLPTIETALEFLAAMNGPADTLDAPLTFKNGEVFLGPFSLGPAPVIILR